MLGVVMCMLAAVQDLATVLVDSQDGSGARIVRGWQGQSRFDMRGGRPSKRQGVKTGRRGSVF